MFKRIIAVAVLATPLLAGEARGQTWDAPLFFSPQPHDDIALYYVRTDRFGEDANGLKGSWRQTGNINLGVQAGIGDFDNIGNTLLLGVEFSKALTGLSGSTGLSMAWHLGAGAGFGDDFVDLSIPLGVSVGLGLGSGRTPTVTPYVHPRISFDLLAVGEGEAEETITDLGLAADIGVDFNLGERLIIKAGYTFSKSNDIGERKAFGVGLALRTPRKLVVR